MIRTTEHGVCEPASPWTATHGKATSSYVGEGYSIDASSTHMTGAFSESCCASNNLYHERVVKMLI